MKLFSFWLGGWFTMMWIGIGAVVLSAGTTFYGMQQQKKAANQAAQVDTDVADYNARYDLAAAAQLDYNTQGNIRTMRDEANVYMSRQDASYASAGVLSTTGSALASRIANAGRFEQKAQQEWLDSQQKQQSYASAALVGRLEGSEKASSDRMQGTIAQINGWAKIASTVGGAYANGTFSGGGGGNSNDIVNQSLF
jgi:hypothetical protein